MIGYIRGRPGLNSLSFVLHYNLQMKPDHLGCSKALSKTDRFSLGAGKTILQLIAGTMFLAF